MSDEQSEPVELCEDSEEEGFSSQTPTMDYSAPISAVPPRVMLQEEGQVEVSASPAFQCLDDVSYKYISNFLLHYSEHEYYLCHILYQALLFTRSIHHLY